MRNKRRLVIFCGALAVSVFGLKSCYDWLLVDSCMDKGGIYEAQTKACICATNDGFTVCIGDANENTDGLIERMSRIEKSRSP